MGVEMTSKHREKSVIYNKTTDLGIKWLLYYFAFVDRQGKYNLFYEITCI